LKGVEMDVWLITTVILGIGFVHMTFVAWHESKACDRIADGWVAYIRERNARELKGK
jgi:heme/copper-type cytochrome/quinol oxidase subunit 3